MMKEVNEVVKKFLTQNSFFCLSVNNFGDFRKTKKKPKVFQQYWRTDVRRFGALNRHSEEIVREPMDRGEEATSGRLF